MDLDLSEGLLEDIHDLRTILINVATGSQKIQDVELRYTELRSQVFQRLRALEMDDPNVFHSLWDWYKYWKEKGLNTWQSRRDYVGNLYKPVVEFLEKRKVQILALSEEIPSFSRRYGYASDDSQSDITVREDAPLELRKTILDIALRVGWTSDDILDIAVHVGKRAWEMPEPQEAGTSSHIQLRRLISKWEWYSVYDFIEYMVKAMANTPVIGSGKSFEKILNDYLRHAGIGWQLVNGEIITRGEEGFEEVVKTSRATLKASSRPTAAKEIHEAVQALSRRPEPDLRGAVFHAMGSLECLARNIIGDPKATFGQILKRNPDLLPRPLDDALSKVWGYASDVARHINEGREPTREEAELLVGLAATVATYLGKKSDS